METGSILVKGGEVEREAPVDHRSLRFDIFGKCGREALFMSRV